MHRQEHAAGDQAGERDGRLAALLGAAEKIFKDVGGALGRRFGGDAGEDITRPAARARAFPRPAAPVRAVLAPLRAR